MQNTKVNTEFNDHITGFSSLTIEKINNLTTEYPNKFEETLLQNKVSEVLNLFSSVIVKNPDNLKEDPEAELKKLSDSYSNLLSDIFEKEKLDLMLSGLAGIYELYASDIKKVNGGNYPKQEDSNDSVASGEVKLTSEAEYLKFKKEIQNLCKDIKLSGIYPGTLYNPAYTLSKWGVAVLIAVCPDDTKDVTTVVPLIGSMDRYEQKEIIGHLVLECKDIMREEHIDKSTFKGIIEVVIPESMAVRRTVCMDCLEDMYAELKHKFSDDDNVFISISGMPKNSDIMEELKSEEITDADMFISEHMKRIRAKIDNGMFDELKKKSEAKEKAQGQIDELLNELSQKITDDNLNETDDLDRSIADAENFAKSCVNELDYANDMMITQMVPDIMKLKKQQALYQRKIQKEFSFGQQEGIYQIPYTVAKTQFVQGVQTIKADSYEDAISKFNDFLNQQRQDESVIHMNSAFTVLTDKGEGCEQAKIINSEYSQTEPLILTKIDEGEHPFNTILDTIEPNTGCCRCYNKEAIESTDTKFKRKHKFYKLGSLMRELLVRMGASMVQRRINKS